MKRICVFAGSNTGEKIEYTEAAESLGKALAERGIELVYGGSNRGLMGRLADAVLSSGGKAIGIMPGGLFRGEMVHRELTAFYEVKDMHERKALMSELSDGFIALPGGLGTFEEIIEVLSWSQLGIHQKPIGLFNVLDYYHSFYELIDHSVKAGFAASSNLQLFIMHPQADDLLQGLLNFNRPELVHKWKTTPN